MLSLIQEFRFNVSVNMSGSGAMGLGVGVGSYQPGVYMPLKALFLAFKCNFKVSLVKARYQDKMKKQFYSCYIIQNDH